jgi:protein TonB
VYEQAIQRPKGPAKVAGGVTALLVTLGVGYALSTGLAMDIVRMVETETSLAIITPPKPPEILPPPPEEPPEDIVVDVPEPVLVPLPEFIPPPAEPVIVAAPAPPPAPVVTAPVTMPVVSRPDSRPKLRAASKPPYPPASVRAQEEGVTGIEVCVSAQGRVTQASVKSPSGHARLDDAALKWVRGSRFQPAIVGGSPKEVCGHEVLYQWDLEDA